MSLRCGRAAKYLVLDCRCNTDCTKLQSLIGILSHVITFHLDEKFNDIVCKNKITNHHKQFVFLFFKKHFNNKDGDHSTLSRYLYITEGKHNESAMTKPSIGFYLPATTDTKSSFYVGRNVRSSRGCYYNIPLNIKCHN